MCKITIKQGIEYSNGFFDLISVLFFCFLLLFVSLGFKLYWISIFILIITIIFVSILIFKYRKINRIIRNQKIIHSKIIESKSTYDSGEFVFKLERGPIYLLSSYFDEHLGQVFLFESFCANKTFKKIPNYWVDYGDKHILALEAIDVCVNKNNYNEYFFLLDRLYPISDAEIEKMKEETENRRDISFEPRYSIKFTRH